MYKSTFLLLIPFFLFSCLNKHQELNRTSTIIDKGWTFSQVGNEEWFPATVPGTVHLDLLNIHAINDPYFENNDLKQRWIEGEDWEYKTEFFVSKKQLNQEFIELEFEGLDTYASVYLNEKEILKSDNMFRSWQVPVKEILKEGSNKLQVIFTSPINRNRSLVETYPYKLPSGNETDDIETKVASFTRKAAYHFGWDWGPRFVTSGIWREVKLNTWNKSKINSVNITTEKIENGTAYLEIEIDVRIATDELIELYKDDELIVSFPGKSCVLKHEFTVENPKLWWCTGEGDPHLYETNLTLKAEGDILEERSYKYGIRTIELVNEPDSIGTSFFFKLNGKPIFAKGANYIPQDMFIPRVTDKKYSDLISQVKNANMNMIRVWGGGIYENDIFYDLCDQNGILVWQDFMFAGSLYPDDEKFKGNIAQEVKENIVRLRSHPCIALWCGNNEIEVAWHNWGWQNQYGYNQQDSTEIWNNYTSIFHEMIPRIVQELDPSRDYTRTSPLSNWGTAENFNHSSMHYWGVWHGREPFENFDKNVGRFMAEYGFQSFPEMASLQKVMADSSLYLNSVAMVNRQKSYIGNGLISKHIEQYFDPPKSFEEFVSLSQKTQALGMKMAIKAHKEKEGHCMGTLFWQLNDCWPGPSWSVIDYYGNPKEAYKTVQESFAIQP